jgi:D-alanine-D-alanine ligase
MGTAKIKVAVVFGGRSSEHAISCATAAGVMSALDPERYEVIPVGIARDGRWLVVSGEADRWALTADRLPEVTGEDGTVVLPPTTVGDAALTVLRPGELPQQLADVDVVFPLLHGPYGEDGTLQGLLELSDIRYVGAGVLSSALSMDKHYTKIVLAGSGLPVGPYVAVSPGQWERDQQAIRAAVAELGYPVFVKPARAGSSMGVSKVTTPDDLDTAIRAAADHDPKVLVEQAVSGREIECGVLQGLDGAEPEVSLPGEIEVIGPGHDFYDFAAKYRDEASVRLSCPADLPADVTARVQELARATFTAAACEGLARVDCFVTADGEVLVNELNTMPGFTPYSMFPRMWQCSGVDYPALVDRLIHLALRRPVGLR